MCALIPKGAEYWYITVQTRMHAFFHSLQVPNVPTKFPGSKVYKGTSRIDPSTDELQGHWPFHSGHSGEIFLLTTAKSTPAKLLADVTGYSFSTSSLLAARTKFLCALLLTCSSWV